MPLIQLPLAQRLVQMVATYNKESHELDLIPTMQISQEKGLNIKLTTSPNTRDKKKKFSEKSKRPEEGATRVGASFSGTQKAETLVHYSPKSSSAYHKLAKIAKNICPTKIQPQKTSGTNRKRSINLLGNKTDRPGDSSLLGQAQESPSHLSEAKKGYNKTTSDFINNIKLRLEALKADKNNPEGGLASLALSSLNPIQTTQTHSHLRQSLRQTQTRNNDQQPLTERSIYWSSKFGKSTNDLPGTTPQTTIMKTPTSNTKLFSQTRKASLNSQEKILQYKRQLLNRTNLKLQDASKSKVDANLSVSMKDDSKIIVNKGASKRPATSSITSGILTKIVAKITEKNTVASSRTEHKFDAL